MRKKNGKRIGPVPITLVAVFALAAFISAGLWLAPNGSQTAEAQNVSGFDDATGSTCEVATNEMLEGGPCNTGKDSLDVVFAHEVQLGATFVVYVTGGNDVPSVQAEVSSVSAGEEGLDEHLLSFRAGNVVPDKQTISVSRSMADDDGLVYLFGQTTRIEENAVIYGGGNVTFAAKVLFLGRPVESSTEAGTKTERSTIVVLPAEHTAEDIIDTTGLIDTVDSAKADDVDAESVRVVAEFNDANGNMIMGNIVFEVMPTEHAPNVRFAGGGTSRTAYNQQFADFTVENLPKSKDMDSFKVPVMATITSDSGELQVDANIVRKGDAVMVTASAFVCETDLTDVDGEEPAATLGDVVDANRCLSEVAARNDRTMKDPPEVKSLTNGAIFFISATAIDIAGNTVDSKADLDWGVTEDTDNEDDARDAIDPASGSTDGLIAIAEDAEPDTYSITVESSDGKASIEINVVVADKASQIMVSCDPEMIPTGTGLTDCTITVTDSNGNIPSNLTDDIAVNPDRVRVAVRSKEVTLIGVREDGNVDLDEDGIAMFTILLREDAPEGSSITVNVSSTIGSASLQASTTVVYGDALSEPGMPMNVMAEATSHDMITVSWESPADDGGSDITGYMVQSAYMMADGMMSDWMDVDPAHMGMDMMYMDMGLMAETTYYYRVSAINSAGKGEYSDGMAMAMTMMMPSMELGAPSITAMSDAAGMATIMLTPGDNATKHFVWAFPMGGTEGMYSGEAAGDATSVTMSGLTSGTSYWFIALAGRGTGTDSEWSAWSGWTAATLIQ